MDVLVGLQLELPLHVEIFPTVAMERGASILVQCSACGTLVCSDATRVYRLGACPACGGGHWSPQEWPTGPFFQHGQVAKWEPWLAASRRTAWRLHESNSI